MTADIDAVFEDPLPIASLIRSAAKIAEYDIEEPSPPVASDSLLEELQAFLEASNSSIPSDLEDRVRALDEDLQVTLAPVIHALTVAYEYRQNALSRLFGDDEYFFDHPLDIAATPRLDLRRSINRAALRGDVDVEQITQGAIEIAAALDRANLSQFRGRNQTFQLDANAGQIAIQGSDDDRYDDEQWNETVFLLELGGDDTYLFPAGANASVDNGIALVIDLDGADTYAYDEVPHENDIGPEGHIRLPADREGRLPPRPGQEMGPISMSTISRQGAGRLGIGMLIDLGVNNDQYRSLRMSQGYGYLGVGILWDEGGDDLYHGESHVQAHAAAGIGLLVDQAGSDSFRAYTQSQASASSLGVGILSDYEGDDEYFLHPNDVLYPSAQDPEGSNASLGQGMGFGRRANGTSDRNFMSGGFALLRDRAGNDRYTAGIFAQGSGYWFGTGMLIDGAGDDHYDAQWYVQSGAAHYAISVLIDEEGNDQYNQTARRQNVMLGGGHDFSVSWFIDRAGNDSYLAASLSLGAGNAAGFGIFADARGTDTYETSAGSTYGNANQNTEDALRIRAGTIGVFLDADGDDQYTRPPRFLTVEDDMIWTQFIHEGRGEQGIGIDRTSGRLGF